MRQRGVKTASSGKIKDMQVKSCYCCRAEVRVAFVLEAASRDAVLALWRK
ncbi:MAG: hypothetical protein ACLQO7_05750 [Candidatus Bathyarchaeia archaeon]